ncbi:hypothetical protein M0R45_038301 [Rubus argutus]|uniref:Uncharacterized protein n=1 Tax=Rubus argutus TaxID=59490 RepID=A0AAW1W653_RUBAR
MMVVLKGSVAAGPSNQGSGKETQDGNVAIMWTPLYCHTPTVDWVVPRPIPMTGLSDTFPAIVCPRGNRSQGWKSRPPRYRFPSLGHQGFRTSVFD